ncbi:hypothetical protein PYCCODRAFT_1448255 [Trametes coccinea BRFM310]|uniref:SAM domain-containing protein n=1 Tax=Trametes coccinea (strain BRFM310) TaxID=1353009 RepID=A0A1Y2I737_TRAC3|nr:hypothetical protein PYCCODRAFT_1448255 [Trametes coccinea BRFM310]
MATARTLPPTPPVPSIPLSPNKKDSALKPNPHPYAIKTTSTALLTRSNTSGYNVNATRHYYVPLSPNATRSEASRGHRASKSLTSMSESPTREAPRPLPIPPALDVSRDRRTPTGNGGYVSADEATSVPRQRPRRSETLPVIPLPAAGSLAPPPSIDELPDNPKLWTPSQLATYLTSALRVTSNGKPGEVESIGLPPLVAKDIAAFVKSARIGGRTFLRMNEEDLEALGMNKKWRQALLAALRNLRQNVLKGRIWGTDGSPTTSPSPEFESPVQLFSNAGFNSSSSSISSSSSVSAGEDERGEAPGAALERSKARRYRSGRVRGMVETFERSGSFSSEGGLDDGEIGPADRERLRRWARQEEHTTGQSVIPDESPSPSRRRPLPVPPTLTGSSSGPLVDDEEPTMEALLANLGNANPVIGARAWEEMDLEPGVTVKRLPSNESDANVSVDRTLVGSKSASSLGSGRGSGGSNKGKSERRVVTAIFAPASSAAAHLPVPVDSPTDILHSGADPFKSSPLIDEATLSADLERPLPPLPDIPDTLGCPVKQEAILPADDEPSRLERLLEAEITETRALLDTFRARLEVVEQKVAELEANEARRETEIASANLGVGAVTTQTGPELHTSVEIGVQSGSAAVLVVDAEVQSDSVASSDAPFHSSDLEAGCGRLVDASSDVDPPSSSEEKRSTISSGLQGVIPDVVRRLQSSSVALFSSSAAETAGAVSRGKDEGEEDDQPSNVSDLPSYVFLVGLGVCAVVLQVVLRKVVGRGAVSGWRP